MCINSWCPEKDHSTEKNPTTLFKIAICSWAYSAEARGWVQPAFQVVTSVTLTWKKPSAERCCIPRCVWLHLESKTLLSKDSFFHWPAELQPTSPTALFMPQAGQCTCPRLGRCFPDGCCCWTMSPKQECFACGAAADTDPSLYQSGRKALSTGTARTQHKNLQCCVNAGPLFIAPQSVQTSVTGFYMTLGYILTWINGKCFSSEHLGLYFI